MTVTVDLEYVPRSRRSADIAQRWLAWKPPALPDVSPSTLRRWSTHVGWAPPGTTLLQRFVNLATMEYRVSTGVFASDDWLPDRNLGLLHTFAQPGTARLIRSRDRFALSDVEGGLQEGIEALGFVETAAFPMLDPIQRRVHRVTRQEILVAGRDDPLLAETELVEQLGFVDHFPIRPFPAESNLVNWAWGLLYRRVDASRWVHRYEVCVDRPEMPATCLGKVALRPSGRSIRIGISEGALTLPDACGDDEVPTSRERARWVFAPARWARAVGESPKKLVQERGAWLREHGVASRTAARTNAEFFLPTVDDGRARPLFGARHPITNDVFLSRSPNESQDMGYRSLGILGFTVPAIQEMAGVEEDVPWASRLGRGRRMFVPSEDQDGPVRQSAMNPGGG